MNFLNDVKFTATTSGLADFGIGAAVDAFQTPASAGAINDALYSYTARRGAQFESGVGTYRTVGPTLDRTTVKDSSAGVGVAVNFTSAPTVILTPLADDIPDPADFATAAQGSTADTAVQPGDLGTAAAEDVGAFATAAQGSTADTAVQPGDLATVATTGDYDDLINLPAADGRTILTADASYYVDNTTGSDANDGSVGSPFATAQYAWNYLSGALDLGQFSITINLAASVTPYTLQAYTPFLQGATVYIRGAGSATTTLASFVLGVPTLAQWIDIDGFTLTGGFFSYAIGYVNVGSAIGDIVAGDPSGHAHFWADGPSVYLNVGTVSVTHDAPRFFSVGSGAVCSMDGTTVTGVGTRNFSDAFAVCYGGGLLNHTDFSYTGTVTGRRFDVNSNSIIDVGGDPNFFPGDVAGTVSDGGQYVGLISERKLLLADASYYVDNTTGSDTNDGSVGAPFATLQYAWDFLTGSLDLVHFNLTINLAASATGYSLVPASSWIGGSTVNIVGAGSATTTFDYFGSGDAIAIQPVILIDNVTLKNSFRWSYSGTVIIGDLGDVAAVQENTASDFFQVTDSKGAYVLLSLVSVTEDPTPNSTFSCSAGYLEMGPTTLYGSPAYIDAGVVCENFGYLTCDTQTGAATGKRFRVSSNAVIDVGGDPNFFLGDVDGTWDSGGIYIGLTPESYVGRTLLTVDTTFYVATTGSDTTGDGSVGSPWATLQHASDTIANKLDLSGKTVTIQVADGTYDGVAWYGYTGVGNIVWLGNNTTPANVIIQNGATPFGSVGSFSSFSGNLNAQVWVSGFKMAPTSGPCIDADGPDRGIIILGEPTFLLPSKNIFAGCQNNSAVLIGNIVDQTMDVSTIDGDAISAHTPKAFWEILKQQTNSLFMYGPDYNVTGTLTVSRGFIVCVDGAIGLDSAFGGAANVVGPKYDIGPGGKLFVDAMASLAGSTAGKINGGQLIVGYPNVVNNFTVADLPLATGCPGQNLFVTDSNATLAAGLGNTVAGSGANKVPAYSDDTDWRIG